MGKSIIGKVTSDIADKTIVITVVSRRTDPLYKKQYSVRTKYMAHDEKNEARVGDKVSIVESRPLSARKRFTLDKVIEKAAIGFRDADATSDVPDEPKAKSQKPKVDDVAEAKE